MFRTAGRDATESRPRQPNYPRDDEFSWRMICSSVSRFARPGQAGEDVISYDGCGDRSDARIIGVGECLPVRRIVAARFERLSKFRGVQADVAGDLSKNVGASNVEPFLKEGFEHLVIIFAGFTALLSKLKPFEGQMRIWLRRNAGQNHFHAHARGQRINRAGPDILQIIAFRTQSRVGEWTQFEWQPIDT